MKPINAKQQSSMLNHNLIATLAKDGTGMASPMLLTSELPINLNSGGPMS